jgi:hypothetical protein
VTGLSRILEKRPVPGVGPVLAGASTEVAEPDGVDALTPSILPIF